MRNQMATLASSLPLEVVVPSSDHHHHSHHLHHHHNPNFSNHHHHHHHHHHHNQNNNLIELNHHRHHHHPPPNHFQNSQPNFHPTTATLSPISSPVSSVSSSSSSSLSPTSSISSPKTITTISPPLPPPPVSTNSTSSTSSSTSNCPKLTSISTSTAVISPSTSSATAATSGSGNFVKLCHVCGDKAIAFNFNGLTCESCKSFFRRNAFKIHKFKCNRNNNCRIELYNRKYCQFCRLQKCFDIGMKKELVLDRKRKHERNAALKQVEIIRIFKDIDGDESATNALLVELLTKLDPVLTPELSKNNSNSNANSNNSTPNSNSPTSNNSVIPTKVQQPEKRKEEEDEDSEDHFSLLDAFPCFALDQFELNPYEQSLINEVNLASSVFTEELSLQVCGEAKSFRESCNLPALYIRKIIRFCKNTFQFRMLNKEDQLLIIKPYFTEILLIRFAFAYNYEHDAISVIENEIEQNAIWVKIDLLKEANRHSFALVYRKYMFQSKMEMESDITARNLLATILMFRTRENMSCPEYIRYSHILYKRLLSRYLEAKYREKVKAEEKYEKLMHVLERACDITHSYSELYTLLDIKEVTGVLKEIYDLK